MARKPLWPVAVVERPAPERGRRARRILLAVLCATVISVAIGGCVILKSVTSSQLSYIGAVQLTTVICATDKGSDNAGYSPADATCQGNTTAQNGNSTADSASGVVVQVKVAYRVPSSVTAPSTFTSANTSSPPTTPCGSGIVFNQSSSYASALESSTAAGSGKKWVGYISTSQTFANSGCQYITVSPQFTLTQSANQPFTTPFNYRVVVGYRTVNEGQPGNDSSRAVTCGGNAFATYSDGIDNDSNGSLDQAGICVDTPQGGAAAISSDLSLATHDLGVIPTNTSVNAGGTASVPFNLKWSGTLSSVAFGVGASTTVPGATATPSITTLTPAANSNNNMTVSVPVPPGTAPGTYNVTVTATGSGAAAGQTRSGTATLTVGALIFNPAPTLPSLGTITLNGQAQTKNAQMNNFGVNDTTTSPAGWNVTVAGDATGSAVFKQYCNNGGSACGAHPANSYVTSGFTLPANSLTMNSTGASFSGGTGSAPTFQCAGGSCAIDSSTPTKIASATSGNGTGLWSTTGFTSSSIRLSSASTLRALPVNEIYRLNAVWSLNSGP